MIGFRFIRGVCRTLFTHDGIKSFAAQFSANVISGVSLTVVAGLATGIVLTMQFGEGMARFGATSMIPSLVALTVVRGTGPLLSALLFAGKAGGSVAAELASMVSTQQFDALKSVGVDPIERVIAPRFLALLFGAPLLALSSIAAGLVGCLAISMATSETSTIWFINQLQSGLKPMDVIFAVFKSFIFGAIVAIVSSIIGSSSKNKTAQLTSVAATSTVVRSSFAIIAMDVVLTKLNLWLQ